jgi:hypothetical protein
MITDCRSEGLARFSEKLRPYLASSNNIKTITVSSFLNYSYLLAANELAKYVAGDLTPSKKLIQMHSSDKPYFMSCYAFGMYMLMVIYIADHEQNLRIAIHKNNLFLRIKNNLERSIYKIGLHGVKSSQNSLKLENIMARAGDVNSEKFQKYAKVHDWIIDNARQIGVYLESISMTEDVYIITSATDLKTAFAKYSIMNPVQFLDKYEWACEKLKIKNKILERGLFTATNIDEQMNLRRAA